MNWYQIFYWVTVADGIKAFFNTFAVIFTIIFIIGTIGYFFTTNARCSEEDDGWDIWVRAWKRVFTIAIIAMPLFWAGWIFCPSKKDAVIIIAGGAVGNFITSDSSARQIPSELTLLIRQKMKDEIEDLKSGDLFEEDTLKNKTKEELIEILKQKK